MARIISIVNQKGGTGKSACTANLAVGLAQNNKKVLIVDADPQSDVSAGFGYRDCDDSNETLTALMDHMPTEVVMHFTEPMLQERLWQKNSIIIV